MQDVIEPFVNKLRELSLSLTSPGLTASEYERTVARIEIVTRGLRHAIGLSEVVHKDDRAVVPSLEKSA